MNDEELLTAYIAERLPELLGHDEYRDAVKSTLSFSAYKLQYHIDVLKANRQFKWLLFIFVVGVVLIILFL